MPSNDTNSTSALGANNKMQPGQALIEPTNAHVGSARDQLGPFTDDVIDLTTLSPEWSSPAPTQQSIQNLELGTLVATRGK